MLADVWNAASLSFWIVRFLPPVFSSIFVLERQVHLATVRHPPTHPFFGGWGGVNWFSLKKKKKLREKIPFFVKED